MKGCNKCQQGKDESEFNKDKKSKDRLQVGCRECQKEYHTNNKEEINQKNREYREIHREELDQKSKENKNSPLPYNSTANMRKNIEKYEEVRESENGNTACKCAYDGDGFEPTRRQIDNRLAAMNDETEGEGRLYCSDKCKESCSIYKKKGYEEGYQPATSREVQPALRKMVFARDNFTCQHCNTHKDDLEISIHCHHKEGVQGNPLESADVDKCKTLCKNCHDDFHSQPGFKRKDYQCPPHLKYNV